MRRRTKRNLALGDLQAEVMAAVWKLGAATVDEVRAQQPPSRRSAYNTVQTVLNRLLDRGLLTRERRGKAFVYH
ncbi:MAG: BlaI/MecI/CopY family transcriptional regulator, partial [Thermoleophilaceae bacterium]